MKNTPGPVAPPASGAQGGNPLHLPVRWGALVWGLLTQVQAWAVNGTTNTHGQVAEGRTPYQVCKAGLNDVRKAAEAKKDDDKATAASTLDAALARAERQICGVLVHSK